MNGLEYVSETNRFKKEQEYFKCIAEPIHSWYTKEKETNS